MVTTTTTRARRSTTTTLALVGALATLAGTPRAHAQRSSPRRAAGAHARDAAAADADAGTPAPPTSLRLEVTARPDSLRWVFALVNTGTAPIQLVADRRLLWMEITPAPEPPPAPGERRRRRARRAARPVRCRAPDRPPSEDFSPHTTVEPGGRYTEGFDLRHLCGLRLPRALVPGATLAVHYGFADRQPRAAHAIVLDGHTPPLTEVSVEQPIVVPGDPANWPPPGPPPVQRGDPRVAVSVAGTPSAPTIHGLTVTVRVANAGQYPLRTFFRAGQIHFEITGPTGERISCRRPVRDYAPVRDFFVRLTRGGVRETLVLGLICPAEAFTNQGVYRGQAIYESRVSGAALGFESFQGFAASPYFYFRLTRGSTPAGYQPLPTEDPFRSGEWPR